MGGKTGFISKAGHCLATLLRMPQTNQQVAVVVLGATSNTGRFWETRHLFNWLSKTADFFKEQHQQHQHQDSSSSVRRGRAPLFESLLDGCRIERQRRH